MTACINEQILLLIFAEYLLKHWLLISWVNVFSSGVARGIVVATADRTVMGRIANLASDTDTTSTTMSREMQFFVNIIIVASIIMGIAFLIALLALGYSFLIAFVFLIGIIMGNVPEGLLSTVTVSFIYRSTPLIYSTVYNLKYDVKLKKINAEIRERRKYEKL